MPEAQTEPPAAGIGDAAGDASAQPSPAGPSAESQKKELEVMRALTLLKHIRQKVMASQAEPDMINFEEWTSSFRDMVREHQRFEYLVGVAGDTGMGKTSLLNVLVHDTADLAPSSETSACTAAVICFRYKKHREGDSNYNARVIFKSKNAVDAEHARLFRSYRRLRGKKISQKSSEEGVDPALEADLNSIEKAFSQICDWSGMDEAEVRRLALSGQPDGITDRSPTLFNADNPDRAEFKAISHDKPNEFLKLVKPYAGSFRRGPRQTWTPSYWPIVERVDIYLEADVLNFGVVLVDLPGEMDALEERSQVARNYYNRLDKIMVITPCERAKDNRTADRFLREDQMIDLDATGKIKNHGIGVVITKIDHINWENFARNDCSSMEKVSANFPAMFEQYEQLSEQLEDMMDADADDPEKRDIIRRLDQQDHACRRACIEARSREQIKSFQDEFNSIQNSHNTQTGSDGSATLDVFPVSSKAHRDLRRGKPNLTFSIDLDRSLTGIDKLKIWIVQGSFDKRLRHLNQILSRSEVLFGDVDRWITRDSYVPVKLPFHETERISSFLEHLATTTKKSFIDSSQRFAKRLEKYSSELTYKESPDGKLEKRFIKTVDDFDKTVTGETIHFGTYRACIRREGGECFYRNDKTQRYCWQEKLDTFFWKQFVSKWSKGFNTFLPEYIQDKLTVRDAETIVNHMSAVSQSPSLPREFRDAYKTRCFQVENVLNDHKAYLNGLLSSFSAELAEVRRRSRHAIQSIMKDGYDTASNRTGNGSTREAKNDMHFHAEEISSRFMPEVLDDVKKGLAEHCAKLAREHVKKTEATLKAIRQEELAVLGEVCSDGAKKLDGAANKEECKKLCLEIAPVLSKWTGKEYIINDDPPPVKPEPVDDAQLPNLGEAQQCENVPYAVTPSPMSKKRARTSSPWTTHKSQMTGRENRRSEPPSGFKLGSSAEVPAFLQERVINSIERDESNPQAL